MSKWTEYRKLIAGGAGLLTLLLPLWLAPEYTNVIIQIFTAAATLYGIYKFENDPPKGTTTGGAT